MTKKELLTAIYNNIVAAMKQMKINMPNVHGNLMMYFGDAEKYVNQPMRCGYYLGMAGKMLNAIENKEQDDFKKSVFGDCLILIEHFVVNQPKQVQDTIKRMQRMWNYEVKD